MRRSQGATRPNQTAESDPNSGSLEDRHSFAQQEHSQNRPCQFGQNGDPVIEGDSMARLKQGTRRIAAPAKGEPGTESHGEKINVVRGRPARYSKEPICEDAAEHPGGNRDEGRYRGNRYAGAEDRLRL